jgi:hypothetical protein
VTHENFEANQAGITAFMQLVEDISDPSARKSIAEGATDLGATDIPPKLVAALNAMSEDELRFLARLKSHLECVDFYDELGNPKLYYL